MRGWLSVFWEVGEEKVDSGKTGVLVNMDAFREGVAAISVLAR